MMNQDIQINDVSDTSIWVAYYRAKESERSDALFHDPLAKVLIGERGRRIAERMQRIGRYTEWSVISRTVMIDDFIQGLIKDGIDTVLNLGAGLDTRPYRMSLPENLRWIEVDFPHIITLKNERLQSESPKCHLQRIALDLSDNQGRRTFLQSFASQSQKVLVLTEGVIPYLTQKQVSHLAEDLLAQPKIQYWITEYFHKGVYRYLKANVRTRMMQNAPFQFYPENWIGFFETCGWTPYKIQYSGDIAEQYHRKMPIPWWARLLIHFAPKERIEMAKKLSGYMVFKRK